MLIVPVLDVLRGQVVRGVAGRREDYRPIVSRLTAASDPRSVARAFRDQLGLTTLYVADLDAIQGATPAFSLFESLAREGFTLWVDAGLRDGQDARALCDSGVDTVVAGLETMASPGVLKDLRSQIPIERVLVSLDLKEGRPLTPYAPWQDQSGDEIAHEIVATGFFRLLLLDLACVGMGQGTGTEALASRLSGRFADQVRLTLGGGVRDHDDLVRLNHAGITALLVASALHDGGIVKEHIEACSRPA